VEQQAGTDSGAVGRKVAIAASRASRGAASSFDMERLIRDTERQDAARKRNQERLAELEAKAYVKFWASMAKERLADDPEKKSPLTREALARHAEGWRGTLSLWGHAMDGRFRELALNGARERAKAERKIEPETWQPGATDATRVDRWADRD